MTCQSCGKTLPAGARYCIHCGAEQALPTPIAVVAAAIGSRSRREAANAAHAGPVDDAYDWDVRRPPITPPASGMPPDPPLAEPPRAGDDPGNSPVYANAPARHGLAVALIVACLVVGVVGGTAAWWWYGVRERVAGAGTAVEAPPAAAPLGTQAAAPPAPTEAAPAEAAPAAPESAGTDAAAVAQQAVPATAPPPVEITPLSPHRATSRAAKGAPPARDAKAPIPATESTPAAPSHPAVAAASPPPAAAVSDRWARMDQDLSRCTREDFIARVVCSQRVRFRYCDGYWGKVPACPGNPTPERGQ